MFLFCLLFCIQTTLLLNVTVIHWICSSTSIESYVSHCFFCPQMKFPPFPSLQPVLVDWSLYLERVSYLLSSINLWSALCLCVGCKSFNLARSLNSAIFLFLVHRLSSVLDSLECLSVPGFFSQVLLLLLLCLLISIHRTFWKFIFWDDDVGVVSFQGSFMIILALRWSDLF